MFQSITTRSLAAMLGADLVGPPDIELYDLSGIDEAGPGSVTFIRSDTYARRWAKSEASAAIVSRHIEVPGHDPATRDSTDSSTSLWREERRVQFKPNVEGVIELLKFLGFASVEIIKPTASGLEKRFYKRRRVAFLARR